MAALALACLFWVSAAKLESAEPHRLVVYAPKTTYQVDVTEHKGTEYVDVVALLEPLGHVEGNRDGKNWTVSFTNGSRTAKAKFRDGKKDADLPSGKTSLGNKFYLVDDRGQIPLEAVQSVSAQLSGLQAQYHSDTRHLYLGGVSTGLGVELKKNPSRLVLSFSAPVAPQIEAEGNTLHIIFTRDPVQTAYPTQEFHDPVFVSGNFAETSSGSEYTIKATGPLVANSSDGGKMLTISAPAATPASAPQPTPTAPAATPAHPEATTSPAPQPAPQNELKQPAFLVVIDAAHGGADTGATLSDSLKEKDVTLALARRLAHELQQRGVQVTMLRNSDIDLNPEQRAATTNTAHAAVYIGVHASAIGHGVRLFTALMPPSPIAEGRRAFVPWNSAQSPYVYRSGQLSGSIAFECNRKEVRVRALQDALMPLNNIATAAVAIELAPSEGGVGSLNSSDYQQGVAIAVADGIASLKAEGEKK